MSLVCVCVCVLRYIFEECYSGECICGNRGSNMSENFISTFFYLGNLKDLSQ